MTATIKLASELAKQFMTGTRKKSSQPAWTHPEAVAGLVTEVLLQAEVFHEHENWYFVKDMIVLAWLHDIIEDGIKEDGSRVTSTDLVMAGIPLVICGCVAEITHLEAKETKEEYLKRLLGSGTIVKTVKVLDRIATLKEGKAVLGSVWAKQYAQKTEKGVMPLAKSIHGKLGMELSKRLAEAIRVAQE